VVGDGGLALAERHFEVAGTQLADSERVVMRACSVAGVAVGDEAGSYALAPSVAMASHVDLGG